MFDEAFECDLVTDVNKVVILDVKDRAQMQYSL